MKRTPSGRHRAILKDIARRAMVERGFFPEFSGRVLAEVGGIEPVSESAGDSLRDLRGLAWSSIDNDDSRDLDQLTVAEALRDGSVKVLVAVADVDARVARGLAIDGHACHNTTSVYTPAEIFHMLPERLSTDLTSLNFGEDRPAVVVEMVVDGNGFSPGSDIYRARVRNHAKLDYDAVAAWLEGTGPAPGPIGSIRELGENIRLQDRAAQRLRSRRIRCGALSLETVEALPVFDGGDIREFRVVRKNRARLLIEDLMIAANTVTAQYLETRRYPSLRRVVHAPKRWNRIVAVAAEHGFQLPEEPDSKALERFLTARREAEPARFHDLSQMIIKLIGPGAYVAEYPGQAPAGHFGLAVRDYTHSTAPNRRFSDLVTQRLLKAAVSGGPAPYGGEELAILARHINDREDDANKVERRVRKSAAALLLQSRIGERFDAVATGAAPKGTWVRIGNLPIEGRLVNGFEGVDVGDRLRVELVRTDVEQGFIDFRKAD